MLGAQAQGPAQGRARAQAEAHDMEGLRFSVQSFMVIFATDGHK